MKKRRDRIWWAYESIIHTESQIRPNEGQYGRKRVTARRRKLSESAEIGVSEVQQHHLLKYGTISENRSATTLASRAQLLDALMMIQLEHKLAWSEGH